MTAIEMTRHRHRGQPPAAVAGLISSFVRCSPVPNRAAGAADAQSAPARTGQSRPAAIVRY